MNERKQAQSNWEICSLWQSPGGVQAVGRSANTAINSQRTDKPLPQAAGYSWLDFKEHLGTHQALV